jgi:hypothetical protein
MALMDRWAFVDAKPAAKHSHCGVALPRLQSFNTAQLQPSKAQQLHPQSWRNPTKKMTT